MIHTIKTLLGTKGERVVWATDCDIQVYLPKQRHAVGTRVNVPHPQERAANQECAVCFGEHEQRPVEMIEQEQRRVDERGMQTTFDDRLGSIETTDELGEIVDDRIQVEKEDADEYG